MAKMSHHKQIKPFWPGRLSALLPLALFAWFAVQLPRLSSGESLVLHLAWVPSMGIDVVLTLDGLSGLFGMIITGIGTLILVYADAYMHGHPQIGRFFFYLHAFLFSMLGLVVADNLMMLFIFWELTTLFSFLLIGFEHASDSARSNARQALLVTGAGGLVLLVGILMAGGTAGTYLLSELTVSGDLLRDHPLYLPILICMLIGAFTKSAQLPFHFWLPNAMSAPTPISAFLHSATMVKAGIYLLMRLHPILGGTQAWMVPLVVIGAATAVWGSVVALGQSDLKKILAHTTIMALGIITMLLGGRTTPALTAAVTFLLVHALYKSALFMVVGNIDHQTGTREIHRIGGMGTAMPYTAAAAGMAALSMAGFPLFLGFIGKEIMYKGTLTETVFPELATTAALCANAMMASLAAAIALRPFWGRAGSAVPVSESPQQMWIGPLVLSSIGLLFGLVPDWVARWMVEPAVLAFHPTTEVIQLKLFHGINEPLLLSILTLSLGALIYFFRRIVRQWVQKRVSASPVSTEGLFNGLLDTLLRMAGRITTLLQSGSLFNYLMIIIGTVVLMAGWALMGTDLQTASWRMPPMTFWQAVLIMLMLVSVVVTVRSSSRLLSISALGVIGAGMALIFLSHGAPDVALTQLLVETLTLIIAAIILLRLPRIGRGPVRRPLHRMLSTSAAMASGLVVTALLLAVGQYEVDRTITEFYEAASYVEAHGRNIVNVILVDFRSLDTLGEIVVVAASAMAALTLIRSERRKR